MGRCSAVDITKLNRIATSVLEYLYEHPWITVVDKKYSYISVYTKVLAYICQNNTTMRLTIVIDYLSKDDAWPAVNITVDTGFACKEGLQTFVGHCLGVLNEDTTYHTFRIDRKSGHVLCNFSYLLGEKSHTGMSDVEESLACHLKHYLDNIIKETNRMYHEVAYICSGKYSNTDKTSLLLSIKWLLLTFE